jgi:hypothetical protein
MIFDPEKLLLLLGPCSLESLDTCRPVADALAKLQQAHPELNILFKGSFDKANRTSIKSDRGTGIDEGLDIFRTIQSEYGFKTITDIHLPEQCAPAGAVVDALQIPAFLCRQTDLLIAAAATDCAINVKKGQFLSPHEMEFVTNKLEEAGASEIWLTMATPPSSMLPTACSSPAPPVVSAAASANSSHRSHEPPSRPGQAASFWKPTRIPAQPYPTPPAKSPSMNSPTS